MNSNTDSLELVDFESFEEDTATSDRRQAAIIRIAAVGLCITGLVVLLVVLPLAGVTYPYSRGIVPALIGPSETLLRAFGITPVLCAVAALTMVAMIRELPYGIGAVTTLTVGASLTTAAARTWADGWVPTSALPNGYVTASLSLICAATLVASAKFLPVVWGLGTVAAATVAAAAVLGGSATVIGIATTLLIVAAWWAWSSAVMLYSPVAAEREARNPLDTAAMALRITDR